MERKKSKNYHDYFIKDGRFIGRFEEMYQNVEDPWHIDALGRRLDMEAALLLLGRKKEHYQKVLDVGCGKGFFTHLLLKAVGGRIWACDVSSTAVDLARRRYPDDRIDFFTFDLNLVEKLPFPKNHFDLIVMAQTIWCILPNLRKILFNFENYLKPDGNLLISQHFLKPEDQKYGREILASAEDLSAMLIETGFDVLSTLETNRLTNHHLALLARPGS